MSLLEVNNLRTSFFTHSGEVKAMDDVSYTLERGDVLGIVGESGSGKSVTAYSILQILQSPGKIVGGSVKVDGVELVGCTEETMRSIRGKKIGIIFQDPMTSLNPVYTVGNQLVEAIALHADQEAMTASETARVEAANKNLGEGEKPEKPKSIKQLMRARAVEMLSLCGINEPEKRMDQYPFELSGGMRQRVMIAMALVCEPDILIADEPTTALDVTIQAQILELMKSLQAKFGMAIILITHDLGVVAGMCDKINVMYAGRIVESGTANDIFYDPKHEYTKGLLTSIPNIDNDEKVRLIPISGTPVDLLALPAGCAFAPRCPQCMKICLEEHAPEMTFGGIHRAYCWMNVKHAMENRNNGEGGADQ